MSPPPLKDKIYPRSCKIPASMASVTISIPYYLVKLSLNFVSKTETAFKEPEPRVTYGKYITLFLLKKYLRSVGGNRNQLATFAVVAAKDKVGTDVTLVSI